MKPAATDPKRWQEFPPERLGLMSGYVWQTDPKRLLFVLARYKFVAKMLEGRGRVLEIGCADAFGTRIVAQAVGAVLGIDVDLEMLDSALEQTKGWVVDVRAHDLTAAPFYYGRKRFDAAYAIDVLEHIHPADEHRFLDHARRSVTSDGLVILGTPSAESQAYASEASREGHVNCKTQADLRALCEKHFATVLLFGMNDEVVHTGFGPMCHYLWAVCSGPRG